MPTLANIQGSSLAPDLTQALNLALNTFGTPQSRAAEAQKLSAAQQAQAIQAQNQQIGQQAVETLTGDSTPKQKQDALIRFGRFNPQAAAGLQKVLAAGDAAQLAVIKKEVDNGARRAKIIKGKGSFKDKQRALSDMAANASARGEDLTRLIELSNMSEGQLDVEMDKMLLQATDIKTITGSAPGAGKKFTKGAGVRTKMPDGSFAIVTPVLDETTGQVVNQTSPIPGELVSTIGETGAALTSRKIGEAGGVAGAKADVAIETGAEVESEKGKGRGTQARIQSDIDAGFDAADAIPTVKRSIELMQSVETGGIDNLIRAAAKALGVEGADSLELSTNLGKTVLSQMRPLFGSAFTASEGERLISISEGMGQSTEGNIRLLKQGLRIVERAARRGIRAAEKNNDPETAQELRDAMEFSLTPKTKEPPTAKGKVKFLGFE